MRVEALTDRTTGETCLYTNSQTITAHAQSPLPLDEMMQLQGVLLFNEAIFLNYW